jgi:hypothetical protein
MEPYVRGPAGNYPACPCVKTALHPRLISEVDKLLTVKENSWTNNVIQYSKAMKISSLEISKELYKQKLGEFYKSKINFELYKIREESSGELLFYSKRTTQLLINLIQS